MSALHTDGGGTTTYDTTRATSLESYEKSAYVYDLTPGGEAAGEALAALGEALRRVGGLQAVALRQIEEMLGQLVSVLCAPQPDGERVYALCEDLHTRFKSLTTNAALFMQKVNRLLAAPVLDPRDFALFKADTIAYLNDFIKDLDILAGHIRARLDALDEIAPAVLKTALAAGQAASGQILLDSGEDSLTWAFLAQTHLTGLAEWFRGEAGASTGAGALYEKARAAVLGITRAAERIRESSSSPSSRSADLLNLAARFEAAESDDDAHRLWHAAFGLSPAPQASPGTGTTDQPEHWHDTGKLPARPGQKPPRDIGLIRVTVPEARRLLAASVRQTFRNTWSIWRRRHQARARWHHYQAQLQTAPP